MALPVLTMPDWHMHTATCREKTSTALFFKYNSQLGPPYQVLVDTNFINFSIKNKARYLPRHMLQTYSATSSLAFITAQPLGNNCYSNSSSYGLPLPLHLMGLAYLLGLIFVMLMCLM